MNDILKRHRRYRVSCITPLKIRPSASVLPPHMFCAPSVVKLFEVPHFSPNELNVSFKSSRFTVSCKLEWMQVLHKEKICRRMPWMNTKVEQCCITRNNGIIYSSVSLPPHCLANAGHSLLTPASQRRI